MSRLTDKLAMRSALLIAIDTEESLIDAYTPSHGPAKETEEGVIIARRRIKAFKRVLDRYFGGVPDDPFANSKSIPLHEVLEGIYADKGDDE